MNRIERREEYLRSTGKFHELIAEGFVNLGIYQGGRDSRMDELDQIVTSQIRNEPACYRLNPGKHLTVSDARRKSARDAAIAQNAGFTPQERKDRAIKAQTARIYTRSCECGVCPKCRHREAKKKYLQGLRNKVALMP